MKYQRKQKGVSGDDLRKTKVKVMKNILILTALILGSGMALEANNPAEWEKCCEVVVSTAEVDFAYDETVYSSYFSPAYFNEATNSLHFESVQDIRFIEIHDGSGDLKYKLPVMSSKVRLNKNMLEKGDYRISFELEGRAELLETYVTIN